MPTPSQQATNDVALQESGNIRDDNMWSRIHCGKETDISLHLLKSQHFYLCEHCNTTHQVSATELRLMRMMLARHGYHFAL